MKDTPLKIMLIAIALIFSLQSAVEAKTINNSNIETAAKMNVAENICDINFGKGPGSLVHFVMIAAAELRVDINTAAQMADIRSREIMRHIVNNNRTAQFCRNAKNGKL